MSSNRAITLLQFCAATLGWALLSFAIVFALTRYYYNCELLSSWKLYIPIAILSLIPGLFLYCSLRIFRSSNHDPLSAFGLLILFVIFTFSNLQLAKLTANHTQTPPWLLPNPSEMIISHRLNQLFNPYFVNEIPAYTNQAQVQRGITNQPPETIRTIFRNTLTADEFSEVTANNYPYYLTVVSERITKSNRDNISNYVKVISDNENNTFTYYNIIPSTLLLKLYIPLLKNTIQVFNL